MRLTSGEQTDDSLVVVRAAGVVAAGADHGLLSSLDQHLTEPPAQTRLASLRTVGLWSVQACQRTMMMMMIMDIMYRLFHSAIPRVADYLNKFLQLVMLYHLNLTKSVQARKRSGFEL